MATSNVSTTSTRSPISIAAGFIGAFIVGSLAVQMVRSQIAIHPVNAEGSRSTAVKPVIPSQASLWSVLGER
jgi:hypothetical protein